MKITNLKAFTLIETIVTLMIFSILIAMWDWFFNSIKQNSIKKLIIWEVNYLNDFITWLKISDYYIEASESIDSLEKLNLINKDEFTDIYYTVNVISPTLINIFDNPVKSLSWSEIGDINNAYSDIVIWLELCKYLFDINWNTINWKKFIKKCDEPIKWWTNIYLQWYLLFNWDLPFIEKNDYYYNNNWYFWYNVDITHKDKLIYENWLKTVLVNTDEYELFDILYEDLSILENNKFFIYKMKKLNWDIEEWIYKWTENNFTSLIKNSYISWVKNDSILDYSDVSKDLENRKKLKIGDFTNIQFIYNNPSNFKTSYEEILFIWLNNNENN